MKLRTSTRRLALAVGGAVTAITVMAGTALAVTYDTVNLNHLTCSGYGWADSNHPSGVYAGTSKTSANTCWMSVDGRFVYAGGVYDPGPTPWTTTNTWQGAGPGGGADVAQAGHYLSANGGTGYTYGPTYAQD